MPVYAVKAVRPDGTEETARIEAADEAAAVAAAAASGLTPYHVSLAAARPAARTRSGDRKLATRIARELSVLTAAGLSVEPALAALTRHAGDRHLKAAATSLLDDVRGGAALSEAFSARPGLFPPPFPEIAEAGEAGGALGKALGELADSREEMEAVSASIRGSLIYPAFLLVFTGLSLTALIVFILPPFERLFIDMGSPVPPLAASVFAIAGGLTAYGPVLLTATVLAFFALRAGLSRPRVRLAFDRWLITAPVIRLVIRMRVAAQFCRVLALLLRNGLSAAPALRLAARAAGNTWAVHRLTEALAEVRAGRGFADRIEASDVLPMLAAELLSVGEEVGDLAPAAERLARYYETRVQNDARRAAQLIGPLVIILAGLVIGGVIVSILLALVSVSAVGF